MKKIICLAFLACLPGFAHAQFYDTSGVPEESMLPDENYQLEMGELESQDLMYPALEPAQLQEDQEEEEYGNNDEYYSDYSE